MVGLLLESKGWRVCETEHIVAGRGDYGTDEIGAAYLQPVSGKNVIKED